MAKQNVASPYNEIVVSLRKEGNTTTWMNFEDTVLSEVSQAQKDKCCPVPLRRAPRAVRFMETEGRVNIEGWGRGQ